MTDNTKNGNGNSIEDKQDIVPIQENGNGAVTEHEQKENPINLEAKPEDNISFEAKSVEENSDQANETSPEEIKEQENQDKPQQEKTEDTKISENNIQTNKTTNKTKKQKPTQKEYDEFNRKILEPTFENILTMSKNTIKLHYSKLKNEINAYRQIKSKFKKDQEFFYKGAQTLFIIKINGEQILLYCALPEGSLDKKVYPHRVLKNDDYKDVPIQVTISSANAALKRALELINLVMDINGAQKLKSALPVAYAEKYPFDPNAVIKGNESIPPKENEYEGEEYQNIEGEITKYLTEKITGKSGKSQKKGKEKLDEIRQTAKSLKAAIALAEPIVYFYDIASDRENKPIYINIQQVLNDKFLGKMVPQHFFAIAEGSDRIESLNFLALKAAVIDCNAKPDKEFALDISSRLLIKKDNLKKLIKLGKTENENLIMAFDSSLLEALGDTGIKGITALKEAGIKIMLDNIEQAGFKALTEFYIDYLRLDARYYSEDNTKSVNQLDMITGYTKIQGIPTITMNVDNIKQALFFLSHGIDGIQGRAISAPVRLVHTALKEQKPLPVSGG